MTGLSFDIGKNSGIAVWDGEQLAKVFPWQHQYPYFGAVLWHYRNDTADLFGSYKPNWVAYEEVMTRNKYHAELHFGMVGVLAALCYEWQVPLVGVNTMTMKKQVAGRGNATKLDMMAEVTRRYPNIDDLTHDMADAVAVGLVALSQMEPHS